MAGGRTSAPARSLPSLDAARRLNGWNDGSPVTRECHAGFCEQPEVRSLRLTHLRTVRAQLIARLVPEDTTSLEALNRRLGAWVEGEYHRRPHRGLEGDTPLDRWSATAANVRYPDPDVEIDEMFLFEAKRKVQSDRTVSLDGRLYEVDASLIGEKVSLRFDPARPEGTVTVLHEGKRIEQARRVDPYANCFVKRHPHNGTPQTDEAPQDPPTGLAMRDLGSLSGNTTHDEHDDSDKDVAGGER